MFRKCKSCLLPLLHDILVKCWRESKVSQDMRDAKIITLHKNKGARSDRNNHKGTSLHGIAEKAFESVVLPRLQKLAKRIYAELQCRFRSQRSTIDMIFSVRQCKRNVKNITRLCISLSLTLLKLSF